MTYPHQPDRQEQGQGGYPPQGEFPDSGQSGQPLMGGGYGSQSPQGPQPPRNKTGLWVGIIFATAVVIAFGITAFVVPGFLLSDAGTQRASLSDQPGQRVPGDTGSGDQNDRSSAEALVKHIRQGYRDSDEVVLKAAVCPGSEPQLRSYVEKLGHVHAFRTTGAIEESGDHATVPIALVVIDEYRLDIYLELDLENRYGSWCWEGALPLAEPPHA